MIVNGTEINNSDTVSLTNAIEDYFLIIENLKGFSRATISSYKTDFKQFSEFLERRNNLSNINSITTAQIEDFCLNLLKEKRLHINSVHRKKDSLSSLFKHCVKRGWADSNPVEKVEIARKKKNVRKVFLDHHHIKGFIMADVRVKGYSYATLKSIKMALCFTGMRNQEIRKLNWEDIDLEKNVIRVFDSKNTDKKNNPDNLDREIPICTCLRNALLEIQEDKGPVFKSNTGITITKDALKALVDRSAKQTKLEISLTPHGLRHSFSSNLEKNGATLSDIAFVLGHKPDSTTSGYVHSSLNRIAGLIEKFSSSVMEEKLDNSGQINKKDSVELNPNEHSRHHREMSTQDYIHSAGRCDKQEQKSIKISLQKISEAERIWNEFNGDKSMPANFLLGYVSSS